MPPDLARLPIHATLLIAAGVHPKAIQARLGHASITTTLNTYGHLMPSAYEGVGEKLDRLLVSATAEDAVPSDDKVKSNRPLVTGEILWFGTEREGKA